MQLNISNSIFKTNNIVKNKLHNKNNKIYNKLEKILNYMNSNGIKIKKKSKNNKKLIK